MNIHIFGASGSGTTALGKTLSEDMDLPHFDSDNYYWKDTDPPFTQKNTVEERHKLLLQDMKGLSGWVLSESMDSWSRPFIPLFTAVIFVLADADLRVERLREREYSDYGDRIKIGGDMFDEHEYFIKWAHQYDTGELSGRSLKRHKEWIRSLTCPVLTVNNNQAYDDMVTAVKDWLHDKAK